MAACCKVLCTQLCVALVNLTIRRPFPLGGIRGPADNTGHTEHVLYVLVEALCLWKCFFQIYTCSFHAGYYLPFNLKLMDTK